MRSSAKSISPRLSNKMVRGADFNVRSWRLRWILKRPVRRLANTGTGPTEIVDLVKRTAACTEKEESKQKQTTCETSNQKRRRTRISIPTDFSMCSRR